MGSSQSKKKAAGSNAGTNAENTKETKNMVNQNTVVTTKVAGGNKSNVDSKQGGRGAGLVKPVARRTGPPYLVSQKF